MASPLGGLDPLPGDQKPWIAKLVGETPGRPNRHGTQCTDDPGGLDNSEASFTLSPFGAVLAPAEAGFLLTVLEAVELEPGRDAGGDSLHGIYLSQATSISEIL